MIIRTLNVWYEEQTREILPLRLLCSMLEWIRMVCVPVSRSCSDYLKERPAADISSSLSNAYIAGCNFAALKND